MPFKCAVFGCKGNNEEKVSVFRFPKKEEKELLAKWIHRLSRQNFVPTSSFRVCERHFRKEDVLYEAEFFDEKSGRILKSALAYPRLKEGAVPEWSPSSCLPPTTSFERQSPESKRLKLEALNVEKALRASNETQADLLKSVSPHCYKFLRNAQYFILPHPGTLRRICSDFSLNPGDELIDEGFLTYIKQKFSSLKEEEKIVTLMIDEIHLNSNFDYVGGKVTGMAYNESNAASSAYVFMIRSLLSPYKDVAHILPVGTLSAKTFFAIIKKVVVGLETIGYIVIAVVTDNNAINGKAMSFF
ncbi:hypothetical protein JTE90_003374 [Oedothorax gibbosus]|uniref:THAP-type domain-containing protein n=1 Tax=Oedothorax gibbosus TaxID=931172 RepID=A0AAV6TYM1_9ARAC|nr:hypothetical protein JTE90_003374 [Oedothorax gibbosus]